MPVAKQGHENPDGATLGKAKEHRSVDIKVALIGAVATIIAAVIGGVLAVNAGAVEISLPESGPSESDLEATITSLEHENDQLRSDNEDLQERLDEAASTTTTVEGPSTTDSDFQPSTPTPGAAEIFRETSGAAVTFGYGSCLDLDSRESNWGIGNGDGDVCLSAGLLGSRIAILDHEPTIEECMAQTLLEDSVPTARLEPGLHLCLQTGEGRHAYVRVADVGPELETISLDIRVWDLIDG